MLLYTLRRLLATIPLLVASSILTFMLVTNIGLPQKIEDALAKPNASAAQIESLRRQFGLDKSGVERYVEWSTSFVKGDWGKTPEGADIRSYIWERAQVTLRLLLVATVVSVLLGVMVGVISALRQYTVFDYSVTFVAFLLFSIPTLVLGIMVKRVGAIKLNPWLREPSMTTWLAIAIPVACLLIGYLIMRHRYKYERVKPPSRYALGAALGLAVGLLIVVVFHMVWNGNTYRVGNPKPLIPTVGQATPGFDGSWWARYQDYFWHLLLPTLTLVLIGFAGYSRYVRASMLDTLGADYVRTARAKGISEGRVTQRHAMRNALLPLVTLVALDFGALIGGAVITETIFGWKGMGSLFTEALAEKDHRTLLAFVMVTALSVILFNLIADLLYARLDPRIQVD
jgi:peptide/nickel transport system permease protein